MNPLVCECTLDEWLNGGFCACEEYDILTSFGIDIDWNADFDEFIDLEVSNVLF